MPLSEWAGHGPGVADDRLHSLLTMVLDDGSVVPTAEDFVPDAVFPVNTPEFARMVAAEVRERCGPDVEVTGYVSDGNFSGVVLEGRSVALRLGCRVEDAPARRVTELELIPSVGVAATDSVVRDFPASTTTRVQVDELPSHVSGQLAEWLRVVRDRQQLIGVDAAVYRGSETVWSAGAGFAELDPGRASNPDRDRVRIGSITKTMVTVRALQLVESGQLHLDDRVEEVLTSWQLGGTHASELRVHHLLTHTGGVRETPEDRYFTPADAAELQLGDWLEHPAMVERPPGESWAYSNTGMTLLGQIVADVSGVAFEDDIAEHVFAPLGMESTSFHCPPERWSELMAPFVEGHDGVALVAPVHVAARAAGSVFSTIADMGRWAGEIAAGANGQGRLLAPGTWSRCLTKRCAVPGSGMEMAYGFLRAEIDGVDLAWHNGALPGASAQLWVALGSGLSLALFANVFSEHRPMALERACGHMLSELVTGFGLQ